MVACANVSNLLLARLTARDRQLAIRAVLGGSRARLIAQLLAESALLASVACGLGLMLAWALRAPILAFSPFVGPSTIEVRLRNGGVRTLHGERVFLNLGTHAAVSDIRGLRAAKRLCT